MVVKPKFNYNCPYFNSGLSTFLCKFAETSYTFAGCAQGVSVLAQKGKVEIIWE